MSRSGRKGIALDYGNLLEEIGKRPRRRQAGHPGADHDRVPADQSHSHVA